MQLHAADRIPGVKVIGLTAESQSEADLAKSEWNITDFEMIGDPTNKLAKYIQEVYNAGLEFTDKSTKHPKLSDMKRYPTGAVQPGATLHVKKGGEGILIYRWANESTLANIGGAMGRPIWTSVLEAVFPKIDLVLNRSEGISLDEIEVLEGEIGEKHGWLKDFGKALKFYMCCGASYSYSGNSMKSSVLGFGK